MKHVIAFDVSMGKSYLVVYNALKNVNWRRKSNIRVTSSRN
ncbi:MAG: hypothetical protein WAM95_16945 [Bacillus sp. (in: firmicutes)]